MGTLPLCSNGTSMNQRVSHMQPIRPSERNTEENTITICNTTMFNGFYVSKVNCKKRIPILLKMKHNHEEGVLPWRKQRLLQDFLGSAQLKQVRSVIANNVERDKEHIRFNSNESCIRTQLSSLESYLDKLEGGSKAVKKQDSVAIDIDADADKIVKDLNSVDSYWGDLSYGQKENHEAENEANNLSSLESTYEDNKNRYHRSENSKENSILRSEDSSDTAEMIKSTFLSSDVVEEAQYTEDGSESADFSMVSILVAINIAVFFFEMASPIKASESESLSIPLLYGAKINWLILNGEWWRLVTPMFLHSGLLHMSLSCWALLTFGPQVSRGYGSLTFFLIYLLGGISGNMTSFIHTPDATVGGTGPIFSIIGAWVIYQIQNRETIVKEISESLFQKAAIVVALSCLLCNFSRIDDWTHIGATCASLLYGYLICPVTQISNTSAKSGKEEGIAVAKRWISPWRLLTIVISCIIDSSGTASLSTKIIFDYCGSCNTIGIQSRNEKCLQEGIGELKGRNGSWMRDVGTQITPLDYSSSIPSLTSAPIQEKRTDSFRLVGRKCCIFQRKPKSEVIDKEVQERIVGKRTRRGQVEREWVKKTFFSWKMWWAVKHGRRKEQEKNAQEEETQP